MTVIDLDRVEVWIDLDGSIWVVWSEDGDVLGRTLPRSLKLSGEVKR